MTEPQVKKAHERLKDRRIECGLSQEKLAELVGTSRIMILRFENEKAAITEKWARRLAVHLKCSWPDICSITSQLTEDEEEWLSLFGVRPRYAQNRTLV